MRPIHQICLSQERLMMAKMSYILERLCIPRRLISIRNDGASIQPGRAWEKAKAALTVTYGDLTRLHAYEPLRRSVAPKLERESSSETLVFRIKDTKVVQGVDGAMEVALSPDHPGGELRVSEDEPFELQDLRWRVECEPEAGPDDFYERQIRPHAVEGGNSFICTGAAGTGKSRILLNLARDLKAKGETVKKITLTHVACRRLKDAQTAHHFAIRHVLTGSFRGWVLIDEVGMIPAVLLSILENLNVLGVKFVLFGD
jgi:hypothetical protein